MNMTRRTFVHGSVAGTVSLASGAVMAEQAASSKPAEAGWIDAHVHVWSPDTTKYPTSARINKSDFEPPGFSPSDLFAQCEPSGVSRIVLIQMSFYEYDHSYMFQAMQDYPGRFSAVALIDHHRSDLRPHVEEMLRQGVRGFRLHSQGDAGDWVTDPGMAKLWKLAAEMNFAICPLINPDDIPHIDALCQKFPATNVVIDHFARIGGGGVIQENPLRQLCRLSRFPNTHVKTSAFYALGEKTAPYDDMIPMIKQIYESYGPERLMWASDCPFQVQSPHQYEPSIALIRDRIDFLRPEDKNWMLKKTAEKLFF